MISAGCGTSEIKPLKSKDGQPAVDLRGMKEEQSELDSPAPFTAGGMEERMTKDWTKPVKVDDATLAFGGRMKDLMPSYEELNDIEVDKKWSQLFADWFYAGLESLELEPKEGIDKEEALRHIKSIMGSFEPKHEHKEAGVAFLFSQFFKDAKWKRIEVR